MRHFSALLCLYLLLSGPLLAQPIPSYTTSQRARLITLHTDLQATYSQNYARAEAIARQRGLPIEQTRPDGMVVRLAGISETGELLYDHTYSNTRAAATTRTNSFYAGGSLGLNLSGSSASVQNRLGTWDGARVRATHLELAGRVTQQDNPATTDNHATHTSGTMIAAGRNPLARGMAFGAKLKAWDFGNDDAEMTLAAPDLLVSNHSYGAFAGWNLSSTRTGTITWEWYGDTTVNRTDDYKFGLYNADTRSWDQIAAAAPYYLIVKSVGNNHGDNGPATGQRYYFGATSRTSAVARADQNGYDQIPTYGCAKNILTIGAIGSISNGYRQPSDAKLADFSSWGPTDDGRIKPDLVGVGVSVLSTSSSTDSAYVALSGTSMSGPNVTGSLLLLQEYYARQNAGKLMRASTLKGLAIHTADETGDTPGPDYRFGWGLLNMERAGQAIGNVNNNYRIDEQNLAQGKTYSLTIVASGRGPLVATICWTDPEAATTGPLLNDRTPKLINDLDIRLNDGTATLLPWTMNPDAPEQSARPGDNIRDNVEQVLVQNPVPGKTYTVTVSHKGTLKNSQQDYALLLSGIGGTAYCTSAPMSSAGTRIARVRLGSIDQPGSSSCTTYTDQTRTVTSVQPGQSLPFSVSLGSCDTTRRAVFVRAYADWNNNGSFADAGDTLATSGRLTPGDLFSAPFVVPPTTPVGQFVRLRIVASETGSASAVSACGSYGNGETQDYLLQTVLTANDVAAVALLSPTTLACGSSGDALVSVQVQNLGTVVQQNLPVTVQIFDAANAPVASLTGVIGSLAAFGTAQLALRTPAGVVLRGGERYRFVVSTVLVGDQNPANNQLSATATIGTGRNNGIFAAASCGSDTILTLRNTGPGLAYWYDALTGGKLITVGNQATARIRLQNQTLFAAEGDIAGRIGPATKADLGGGSYGGAFMPQPLLKTETPLLLESARLYIGTAGRLTFSIRRLDESLVSSVTLDVRPTRSTSLTASTTTDDPTDTGAEYALNLPIPQAGQYKIRLDYEDGATIFRSNVGVTGFPYQLKDQAGNSIVTIRGSLFASTATTVDTLTAAWYYLYNLRVRSLACPVLTRTTVPVAVGTPVTALITADGPTSICRGSALTLRASVPTSASGLTLSYRWQRDGQLVSGAATPSFLASTAGSYAVQVTGSCAPTTSSAITVSVREPEVPAVSQAGLVLASNAASGNQWLFNGIPISGATSVSFSVGQTGQYSVQANVNGCGTAISSELLVTILAVDDEPDANFLTVYPNPAREFVTVEVALSNAHADVPTVSLLDLHGFVLRTAPMQRDGKKFTALLPIADLPGGTFFVVIPATESQPARRRRLIKP